VKPDPFGITAINNIPYLTYELQEGDRDFTWGTIFRKLQMFCSALSISSLGHFWTERLLVDDSLRTIWEQPRSLYLVADKEIDKEGPSDITVGQLALADGVTYWVAKNYPRVFIYHRTGLWLLRSNFPAEYLYSEVLLNFYKIVEAVSKSRTGKKPKLDVVLEVCHDLKTTGYSDQEIRSFYNIRSRDAAHDWGKAQPISREVAVECKLLAEQVVLYDMLDRFPEIKKTVVVQRSPSGVIKGIYRL
jgi:hypothetical protein